MITANSPAVIPDFQMKMSDDFPVQKFFNDWTALSKPKPLPVTEITSYRLKDVRNGVHILIKVNDGDYEVPVYVRSRRVAKKLTPKLIGKWNIYPRGMYSITLRHTEFPIEIAVEIDLV